MMRALAADDGADEVTFTPPADAALCAVCGCMTTVRWRGRPMHLGCVSWTRWTERSGR
jgi:hypothetical protein